MQREPPLRRGRRRPRPQPPTGSRRSRSHRRQDRLRGCARGRARGRRPCPRPSATSRRPVPRAAATPSPTRAGCSRTPCGSAPTSGDTAGSGSGAVGSASPPGRVPGGVEPGGIPADAVEPGGYGAPCGARHPAHLETALETIEAGGIPLLPGGGRQQDAGADELELESRRGGAGHLGEPGVDDVGCARQGPGTERRLLHAHPLELVLGRATQHLGRALLHGRDDDEVSKALEEVLDEPPRVVTGLDDPVDLAEGRGPVGSGEGVDGRVEQLPVGEAEQRDGTVIGEALGAGAGDELVEHRQGVTHRPATGPRDEGEHTRRDRDALRLRAVAPCRRSAWPAAPAGRDSGACGSGSCR